MGKVLTDGNNGGIAFLQNRLALYAFREQFTGDGIQTSFTLTGAIENATFVSGAWEASGIQINLNSHVVDQAGRPIYRTSLLGVGVDRIQISSIDTSGNVTLNHPPKAGVDFDVWYWFNLSADDVIENYVREDFVASMEADTVDLQAQLGNKYDLNNNTSDDITEGVSNFFVPPYPSDGTKYLDGNGNFTVPPGGSSEVIIKDVVPPTVNDDNTLGYFVGQRWVDENKDRSYLAQDVSTGAAVWKEITPVGGMSTGDNGETVFESGVSLGDAVTPPTLTANTNDWVVTDIEKAIVLRVSSDGNYSLTGLVPFDDTTAWMLFIANVGINNISLKNNDAGSSANNRFLIGGDKTIQSDEGILLFYDPVSNRWRGSGILI